MKAQETFAVVEWFVVKTTLLILLIAGATKVIVPEIAELLKLFR